MCGPSAEGEARAIRRKRATSPDEPGERVSFAELLDRLFVAIHPADKPEYTYEQVAQGASDAGYDISPAYVWQLRNGKRTNPTLRHIEGLAAFFGVSPGYFLDPADRDRLDDELELIATLRDAGVRQLALRAHGLSAGGIAAVRSMIDHVRELEGLHDLGGPP